MASRGASSFSAGLRNTGGTLCVASASWGLRRVVSVTSTKRPAPPLCVIRKATFWLPLPPPNMPPSALIGLAPPGPLIGMPMPEKVATSIHACDCGGLTSCRG